MRSRWATERLLFWLLLFELGCVGFHAWSGELIWILLLRGTLGYWLLFVLLLPYFAVGISSRRWSGAAMGLALILWPVATLFLRPLRVFHLDAVLLVAAGLPWVWLPTARDSPDHARLLVVVALGLETALGMLAVDFSNGCSAWSTLGDGIPVANAYVPRLFTTLAGLAAAATLRRREDGGLWMTIVLVVLAELEVVSGRPDRNETRDDGPIRGLVHVTRPALAEEWPSSPPPHVGHPAPVEHAWFRPFGPSPWCLLGLVGVVFRRRRGVRRSRQGPYR